MAAARSLGAAAGLALFAGLVPSALAGPVETGSGCGGNAYSSAQVIENRPPHHGPLVAMPDTLCADLEGPRPNVSIDIYGVPGLDGRNLDGGSGFGSGLGGERAHAPYEGSPRQGARRSGDR